VTPHYAITVVWSDEDEAWVADAPDLRFCSAHGDTPEDAVRELRVAMDAWLMEAQAGGRSPPEARYRPISAAAE
jgi:predicted RNase H-like HicB family nuclease